MMKNFALLLLILASQVVLAQNNAFKSRADQAYLAKDYVTAAYYYDKSIDEGSTTSQGMVPYFSAKQKIRKASMSQVVYRLAECYRLNRNFKRAEGFYLKAVEHYEAAYPLARFWYGVCLRANGKLDEAIAALELFQNVNKKNADDVKNSTRELKYCFFAKTQLTPNPTTSIVKMEERFDREENDYALNVSNGQYWFTGTTSEPGKRSLNKLFVSNQDNLSKRMAISFNVDSELNENYGAASLDAAGKIIYITKWHHEGDKNVSSIYFTSYINQQWSGLQKLNSYVNADGYNAMQPFVSSDGKRLYFASNRAGGFGGMDIWVSDLNMDGVPKNAVNLGNTINTEEDENAPFYEEKTKRLVYSSNGLVGMGGFDLYESTFMGKGWSVPHNLGAPYNSTKDDMYYYIDEADKGTAFVSSDRASECCLNLFKIHYTNTKPAKKTMMLTGTVKGLGTNELLSDVKIEFTDMTVEEQRSMITDDTGTYNFNMALRHAYQIRLEKAGYFTKVVPVAALTIFKKDTITHDPIYLQKFEVDKPIVIENILYDFNKAILKPESKVVLDELVSVLFDNPKITMELSAHTDSIGPDWSNNRLSQQRAQSCVDYIISKGISEVRILAKGYGKTMPIQPNSLPNGKDNREGRRLNRRTEFKVINVE